MRYVAFDLEIANTLESCPNWQDRAALGISCAATVASDRVAARVWHGERKHNGWYPHQFTPEFCRKLVDYLAVMQADGYPITTWNGLGFDFQVLALECQHSDWWLKARDLALAHIDMGFDMLCNMGYMTSLEAAAHGMGIPGKPEGIIGAAAPVMWRESQEQQVKVLDYVANDAIITAQLYEAILAKGYLVWTSRSGRTQVWYLKDRCFRTAADAAALPLPDTSWMSNAIRWSRPKYMDWTTRPPKYVDGTHE